MILAQFSPYFGAGAQEHQVKYCQSRVHEIPIDLFKKLQWQSLSSRNALLAETPPARWMITFERVELVV